MSSDWIEKVEEIPEEPVRNDIDKDEWLIARERLKEVPEWIEWTFGGQSVDREQMVQFFKKGAGGSRLYVDITMNAIRSFKKLSERLDETNTEVEIDVRQ